MSLKITILGCGASGGVPALGNLWGQCDPAEPKNRRSRCALAVQSAETTLIVDTGPDFRAQTIEQDIHSIDAILYTHAHGDHVNGIDELTTLRRRTRRRTPAYGQKETMDELQARFAYMFRNDPAGFYPASIEAHAFDEDAYGTVQRAGDIDFVPFRQDHGTCRTLGFRFGDVGYSTDMVRLDDAAIAALTGVKTWIADGAGYHNKDNPVHASIADIIALNERIGADTVYLTHLSLMMDYQTLRDELPEGYYPAYDGLVVET